MGWDDVFRTVGSVALAASYFTPAGAITGPLTVAAGVYGGTVEIIGHATDNEAAKKAGGFFRGIALNAALDGVSGGALEGVKMSKVTAETIKIGCAVTSRTLEEKDKTESFLTGEITYLPSPDPRLALFAAKNIKNIF